MKHTYTIKIVITYEQALAVQRQRIKANDNFFDSYKTGYMNLLIDLGLKSSVSLPIKAFR